MHVSYIGIPVLAGFIIALSVVGYLFYQQGVTIEGLRSLESDVNERRCAIICERSCGGVVDFERQDECLAECHSMCSEAY